MFNLLRLRGTSIFEQLQIEEALLRADSGNWCLINTDAPPSIVMGLSGKPEELISLEKLKQAPLPLIKRFSGGGTVYIDPNTLFVTFIASKHLAPPQPKAIMKWSESIYAPLFPDFHLRENDYVFEDKKFGGNAQYIQKERWLHHTSFLWNYDPEKMDYLLLPKKRPTYREDRPHTSFLTSLHTRFAHKETLIDLLISHFKHTLNASLISLQDIFPILERPHRKATSLLSI